MARNENPAVPEPRRDRAREFWAKGVRGARFLTDGDTLPPIPGAYVLGVDLARPLALSLPGKAPVTLGPGRYFYAGGAHGPGGIKARGSRQMRKRKALRWHIGHLTEAGTVAGILALPQGRECAALAALRVPARHARAGQRVRQFRSPGLPGASGDGGVGARPPRLIDLINAARRVGGTVRFRHSKGLAISS